MKTDFESLYLVIRIFRVSEPAASKCEPPQVEEESSEEKRKREQLEKFKAEIDELCLSSASQPEVAVKPKIESVPFVAPSLDTDTEPKESPSVPSIVCATAYANGERMGLGFGSGSVPSSDDAAKVEMKFVKAETEEKSKEDMFSFQSSFVIPNTKRTKAQEDAEAKRVSLVSKCEEFLQSVKKTVAESTSANTAVKKKKKTVVAEEEKKPVAKEPCKESFKDMDIGKLVFVKL